MVAVFLSVSVSVSALAEATLCSIIMTLPLNDTDVYTWLPSLGEGSAHHVTYTIW